MALRLAAIAAVATAILLGAPAAAQDAPVEPPPSPLHRALDEALARELAAEPAPAPAADAQDEADDQLVLELHSEAAAPAAVQELAEELRDPPAALGGDISRHMTEQLRGLGFDGLVGAGFAPGGLDLLAVARIVGGLLRPRPAETPAAAPEGRTMVLRVRAPDGSTPPTVRVLPVVGGRVGRPRTLSCDGAGACPFDGAPAGPFTLLVRGGGARILHLPAFSPEIVVRLRPEGRLHLLGGVALSAEVLTADGGAVPLPEAQRPAAGRALPVPPAGLTLRLPEGDYRVRWQAAGRPLGETTATVAADGVTEAVPPSARP